MGALIIYCDRTPVLRSRMYSPYDVAILTEDHINVSVVEVESRVLDWNYFPEKSGKELEE